MSVQPLKYLIVIFMLVIAGCSTPGVFPTPPQAIVGNANIALTIQSKNAQEFPEGANIRVSLVNMSEGSLANPSVLAGDDISLTQADRGVRVSFPADRDKITSCNTKHVCAFLVQVIQDGSVVFANAVPVFYRLGQNQVIVVVEKTA